MNRGMFCICPEADCPCSCLSPECDDFEPLSFPEAGSLNFDGGEFADAVWDVCDKR